MMCSTSSQRIIRLGGFVAKALETHLDAIHQARLMMIGELIPSANVILDLGGANSPLHLMGYPHPFKTMTLVDLPPADRHEMYQSIEMREELVEGREVRILYADMTNLESVESESIELVWSGQSIEHVPREAGVRMCHEAFRVLRPGGWFCLDTPNGLISSIHAATAEQALIHPEHFVEYQPDELHTMLRAAGFSIDAVVGIRHMPRTAKTGAFHYLDFLIGAAFSDDVDGSYIQFFRCQKPF
jgi:SAM-dependent methyltransferase